MRPLTKLLTISALSILLTPLFAEEIGLSAKELAHLHEALVAKGIKVSNVKVEGEVIESDNSRGQFIIVELKDAQPIKFLVTFEINGIRPPSQVIENNCYSRFLKTYALSLYLPPGTGVKEVRQMIEKTLFRAEAKLVELKLAERTIQAPTSLSGAYSKISRLTLLTGIEERLTYLSFYLEKDHPMKKAIDVPRDFVSVEADLKKLKIEFEDRVLKLEQAVLSSELAPTGAKEKSEQIKRLHKERSALIWVECALEDIRELLKLEKALVAAIKEEGKVELKAKELKDVKQAISLIEKAQGQLKVLTSVLDGKSEVRDVRAIRQSLILMGSSFRGISQIPGVAHNNLSFLSELYNINERLLQLDNEQTPKIGEVEGLIERINYVQKIMDRAGIEFQSEFLSKEQKAALGQESMKLPQEMAILDECLKETKRVFERAQALKLKAK